LRPLLVRFAAAVIGPLLVMGVGVLIGSYGAEYGWNAGQVGLLIFVVGLLAFFLAGGDLNEWSLHPFYRDRLREGMVGVARTDMDETERLDIALGGTQPTLMLCAAANIADEHLTAPGRPVVPWV